MKISELKECGYYAEFFEILRPDIPSHYKIPNDAIVNYYKTHPKVFKEGDGSHPDMSIEECNDIKRLLFSHPNGYSVGRSDCTESWSKFCYSMGYFGTYTKTATIVTNPIPYKVWLNYLGVEPKEESLNKIPESAIKDFQDLADKYGINGELFIPESPLISERQKKMIEQYNPNPQTLSGGLEIGMSELMRQADIIGQIKAEMRHINPYQFAGNSRKVFNLINQL